MPISPATLFAIARGGQGRGVISMLQLCLVGLLHFVATYALPHHPALIWTQEAPEPAKPADDPGKWAFLGTAIALVLLGGAFAGLTIALMGQDEVYLQVISTSGEGSEKNHATKVLKLLKRGKHWVLVTLLVGNVITNETLPIVLDRSIGGGYAAAISSTVLVIIFGEIVPQSICVRFGLPIGAVCSPFVLVLMWIFAPITWPIAKLLDYLLGEDHGTTYKKAGLKTLVDLHKTMGTAPGERLNEDEVAIISGVLDLKAKAVGTIMTPMDDVFTLSYDAVLDEPMIDQIMREGYSRIPIHDPNNTDDFVGMLLVKMLITYDPEDARKVNEFALATLPETRPDTSCLDIINFFQEGKSHMVLVSDSPGQSFGALGVVTLEDVIEELIGEEIIDESDVFIDVHKALRRAQPAPTHRYRAQKFYADNNSQAVGDESQLDGHHRKGDEDEADQKQKIGSAKRGSTASMDRTTTFLVRRPSNMSTDGIARPVQVRSNTAGMRQQLQRLGPSNAASNPRQSKINAIKVKPGAGAVAGAGVPGTIPENKDAAKQLEQAGVLPVTPTSAGRPVSTPPPTEAQEGIIGHEMVSPGGHAKDGVQALHAGYGTLSRNNSRSRGNSNEISQSPQRTEEVEHQQSQGDTSRPEKPEKLILERSNSHSTLGSMHSQDSGRKVRRHTARSGSITENIIESGGRKKMVLEPSSSSDEENGVDLEADSNKGSMWKSKSRSRGPSHQGRSKNETSTNGASQGSEHGPDGSGANGKAKKKRRPRRPKKKDGQKDGGDENTPLLGK